MNPTEALTAPLARLKSRYDASPLPRFFAWWLGELRACLPPRWRDAVVPERRALLIESAPDGLSVARASSSRADALGVLPAASPDDLPAALEALLGEGDSALPRHLLLPSSAVLRRALSLPLAARENLRTVLGFELDRQTPFKADQVWYDARVLSEDAASRQLRVELALVTRARLDAELARLGPLAATLSAVDARGADGQPLGINLLPPERRRVRHNVSAWINAGLAALAVLLLWAAMLQSLDNRAGMIEALEAEVDTQRGDARGVLQLRKSLDEAVEGANFLVVRRQDVPLAIEALEHITDKLPDETYLERLQFENGTLTLYGLSSGAAALIGLLQESPRLRDVALSGPIQPDPRAGKDRFQLSAVFVPSAPAAAAAAEPAKEAVDATAE